MRSAVCSVGVTEIPIRSRIATGSVYARLRVRRQPNQTGRNASTVETVMRLAPKPEAGL